MKRLSTFLFGIAIAINLILLCIDSNDVYVNAQTYVDSHYVKPHGFRKGVIKLSQ